MIYKITHDKCNLTSRTLKIIHRWSTKIQSHLPNLPTDLPQLVIMLHRQKYPLYSGWIDLILPHKVLRVKMLDRKIENALTSAFKKLVVNITKYEALNYKGSSRNPHHESLRIMTSLNYHS